MSYKAKADAIRTQDEGAYRGGRVEQEPPKPQRLRYPCFAAGCPMPGTIFLGAVQGEKAEGSGCCNWHFGVQPNDIPKVTQRLVDWQCVSAEVNAARRFLTGEQASSPKAVDEAFRAAWARLQPVARSWESELQPGRARTSKEAIVWHDESYGDWARRLERFLGSRIAEVLSTQRSSSR